MKQKIIIAIVAAIIIIGAIVWYMNHHKASAPSVSETTNSNSSPDNFNGNVPKDQPSNANQPTSTTIAVSTQTPGNSITIDNVFLDKPGFVVIHEVDSKGEPGTIIGSSALLTAGAKQDLEIPITVKAGGTYFAMLHEDNGDKKFNATTDKPVLVNGKPVMMMFSVSQ